MCAAPSPACARSSSCNSLVQLPHRRPRVCPRPDGAARAVASRLSRLAVAASPISSSRRAYSAERRALRAGLASGRRRRRRQGPGQRGDVDGDPAEPLVLVHRRQAPCGTRCSAPQRAVGQPQALLAPAARRPQRLQASSSRDAALDQPAAVCASHSPSRRSAATVCSTSPASRARAARFSRTSRRWTGGRTSALTATPITAPSAACPTRCPTRTRHGARGEGEQGRGRRVDALVAEAGPVREQHQQRHGQGERAQRVAGEGLCGRSQQRCRRRSPPNCRAACTQRAVDGGLHQHQSPPRAPSAPAGRPSRRRHEPGEHRGRGGLERLHDQIAFPPGPVQAARRARPADARCRTRRVPGRPVPVAPPGPSSADVRLSLPA